MTSTDINLLCNFCSIFNFDLVLVQIQIRMCLEGMDGYVHVDSRAYINATLELINTPNQEFSLDLNKKIKT